MNVGQEEETIDPKQKHLDRMNKLMEEINAKFEPLLVRAIETHNHGLMNDILKVFTGSADEIVDMNGNNLVAQAAIANDPAMIKMLLLKASIDQNHRNHHGDTALHLAVVLDHKPCINMLLQHGAIEATLNDDGRTAWEMKDIRNDR